MNTRTIAIVLGWVWVVAATIVGPVAYSAMRGQFWFVGLMVAASGMLIGLFNVYAAQKSGRSNGYPRLSSASSYATMAVWISPTPQLIVPAWPSIDMDLAGYFAIVLFGVSALFQRMGTVAVNPPAETQSGPSISS